ncbi:MAG: ATP-dependent Clp protease adaptor ClpS [Lachnospiraceae bacterium]|jgi:ATP-dependent Clp protease adaptor protein ClpS|nr:ATP-dependent Clp protease adaptor ClpS [Lachnospiraceae bacterium]
MAVRESMQEKVRTGMRLPRQYRVLIYNDDFTPMDFVVEILVQIFDKDLEAAVELMLSVHHGSYAVAGIYPRDMAQTKAAEAVRRARAQGYPLKVEAVCQP